MDAPLPKVDRAALRAQLLAEFERTVEEEVDAIDRAPAGRVIRDSEEPAREALDRFRATVYQSALQAKIEAAEAAFSPSGQRSDGASVPDPLAQRGAREPNARGPGAG